MEESASARPSETPDDTSAGDDTLGQLGSKNPALKDRKCQYCHQAFTSSSLGRHLDQFLFKKKPDGVHDVEEIRRIRSGITRRQARTSSGKRDTPERGLGKGQLDPFHASESSGKPRDGPVRMMFNTPTWHATGVINDIPNPTQSQDSRSSRFVSSQSRVGSLTLPEYGSRGSGANNPDTVRALELALREVLDNIKAATSRTRPRLSPFDFDIQVQTFPSLCFLLLPPPPTLFAPNPFPSPSSFPLSPPGAEHLDIVRQAIRAKIEQWQSDQLSAESTTSSQPGRSNLGLDLGMISRNAQQHEDMSLRHLELAFKHWASLPQEMKKDAWQLEIMRAFAREAEKRKSLDDQLARVQQEANQLRSQVEKLGSCQWPREFALFPPDTLPLPRDVARELDAKESQVSPSSSRWDYDNVVAKWKRVIMHDRSMGRVGVGYINPVVEEPIPNNDNADAKPRGGEDFSKSRILQPPSTLSPGQSPSQTGNSAPPSQHPSPYHSQDPNQSPNSGPQAKRQRLMNGRHIDTTPNPTDETPNSSSNSGGPISSTPTSSTWNGQQQQQQQQQPHQQSMMVSNLSAPVAPIPPSSTG
ncbi:hypothetical protein P175DRAFT_0523512 [Aspergillus ochraceoroseus IBT 24754]|uniref:Uncharacterized protein n=1 Tax=Aspergillus ochraceoroseus IBT 24754 TaxID=1392256 RepID=A0A2T5LWH3_9EURO|nr:uncharacterized protein P175DRAFT_0523512 [Aspergillus ochraceoroseus IBT 24754]PTU20630.1 hypothetical protein P175DRAFT_0523512 [Aspergillus ochraceoroseus IBT 24754]